MSQVPRSCAIRVGEGGGWNPGAALCVGSSIPFGLGRVPKNGFESKEFRKKKLCEGEVGEKLLFFWGRSKTRLGLFFVCNSPCFFLIVPRKFHPRNHRAFLLQPET